MDSEVFWGKNKQRNSKLKKSIEEISLLANQESSFHLKKIKDFLTLCPIPHLGLLDYISANNAVLVNRRTSWNLLLFVCLFSFQ